jgi:D-alanyl-D-alanine carboxypeptidase
VEAAVAVGAVVGDMMHLLSLCFLSIIFLNLNIYSIDPVYACVDKTHSLGNYTPADLIIFNTVQVSKRIVSDLQALLKAAQKDGLELRVISGYRSYEKQKKLFESYVKKEMAKNNKLTRLQAESLANKYAARAGYSEHQLGTTVDILSAENKYSFEITPDLKYVKWLEKNSKRFNFRISYLKENPEYIYEPWHVRWYPPQHI